MSEMVIHKALATMPAAGEAGPPSGEAEAEAARDRAFINTRFALVPLAAEEVDLRRMRLANDRVDRTYERFSPAFLARLAATIIGKSVLAHHKKSAFPIGRFYAAEVVDELPAPGSQLPAKAGPFPAGSREPGAGSATKWLIARYYMLRTEATAELRRQIDAGVYSYVSIGFRGGAPRCDLCGSPFTGPCPHWPGRVYETPAGDRVCTLTWEDPDGTAEAVEGSLVWLGAQIGAQHVKSSRGSRKKFEPQRHEGHKEKLTKEGEGEELSLCPSSCPSCLCGSKTRKEVPMDQERIAQLEREVAEYRERAEEAARREPLARDGERYRADLVAEITRLAGLVGAAKEAAFLCESLSSAGAERLKELKAEYERRVEEKLPPQGTSRPADDPRPSPTRDPRAHSVV